MIAHGWIAIDRAWLLSPESPFHKRRQWYAVWHALVMGAAYEDTFDCKVGECRVTARDLAELSCLSKSAVSRCLEWMASAGLIELTVVRKTYQILIKKFCLVDNMRAFLSLEKPVSRENTESGGTICLVGGEHLSHQDNTEKDCAKNGQQKKWDNPKIGGTKVGQFVYHLTYENDGEKECFQKSGGTKKIKFGPIVNNKEIHITNHTSNSPKGEQPSEPSPEPTTEASPTGEVVTAFDLEIAREWYDRMEQPRRAKAEAEGKPYRPKKSVIKKWAEAIAKLRRLDGLSEDQVRMILRIRFEDDFYKTVPMCPPALRRVADNGRKKFENILAKAERLPKPPPPPKRLASGEVVSSSGMTIVMPGCELDD